MASSQNNNTSGEFTKAWDSLKSATGSLWSGSVSAVRSVADPVQEKTLDWFHKTKDITADTLEKSKGYVDNTVKYASETVATGREKTENLIQTVQERQHNVVKALQGKAHEQADAANAAAKAPSPPKKAAEAIAAAPKKAAAAVKTTERGELDWVKVCLAVGLGVLVIQGVIVGVSLYKNNKKGDDDKPAKKLDD